MSKGRAWGPEKFRGRTSCPKDSASISVLLKPLESPEPFLLRLCFVPKHQINDKITVFVPIRCFPCDTSFTPTKVSQVMFYLPLCFVDEDIGGQGHEVTWLKSAEMCQTWVFTLAWQCCYCLGIDKILGLWPMSQTPQQVSGDAWARPTPWPCKLSNSLSFSNKNSTDICLLLTRPSSSPCLRTISLF